VPCLQRDRHRRQYALQGEPECEDEQLPMIRIRILLIVGCLALSASGPAKSDLSMDLEICGRTGGDLALGRIGAKAGNPVGECFTFRSSTRIVDAGGDRPVPGNAHESRQESPFKRFITAVTEHIVAKTGQDAGLVFTFRPLIESQGTPGAADGPQMDDACRLESPWARLALRRSPDRFVRAEFIWNERQFLLDQALLSGAQAWPDEPLVPISVQVFSKFAEDYAQTILLAATPEAAAEAVSGISKRIPPDLMWLFQHAWQSTRGPFAEFARAALADTIRLAGPRYIELAKALVDRCLTSGKAELRYENILDLKEVVMMDHYRINRLH
jgi:hypothetical protein